MTANVCFIHSSLFLNRFCVEDQHCSQCLHLKKYFFRVNHIIFRPALFMVALKFALFLLPWCIRYVKVGRKLRSTINLIVKGDIAWLLYRFAYNGFPTDYSVLKQPSDWLLTFHGAQELVDLTALPQGAIEHVTVYF